MKIVVASDSNGYLRPLRVLRERHRDADLFLHLGNHGLSAKDMEGYVCVAGSKEAGDESFPVFRILNLAGHDVLMVNGYTFFPSFDPDLHAVAEVARNMACDICLFGHTRLYCDATVDGIRLLNPGSVYKNKDNSPPSYMVVDMDAESVAAVRMEYPPGARRTKDEG